MKPLLSSTHPTGFLPGERGFGHSPQLIAFWRNLVSEALERGAATPFYLLATSPIEAALAQLQQLDFGLRTRHWLSCKTQPLPALLHWWRRRSDPIEVVSEFELQSAQAAGFPPDDILINGPAKHRWLPRYFLPHARVNFDSPTELACLSAQARRQKWRMGLRLRTPGEVESPDSPRPTQFGFERGEAIRTLQQWRRARVAFDTLHFHLRTNVAAPTDYARALDAAYDLCRESGQWPRHLDCGGGLPPPHTRDPQGTPYDRAMKLDLWARTLRRSLSRFPDLAELWLENGRFVLARSGVLVVRIWDRKQKLGIRQLICDGGRTMNALISQWERHALVPWKKRSGRLVPTIVYGPTCMAFDQLAQASLSNSLRPGDYLIWLDAGAYHLPWETRFSHGLAEVWWFDRGPMTRLRNQESFEQYRANWVAEPPSEGESANPG